MFALTQDNKVIKIDDAEKKVDYICSDCNSILRVKDGAIKAKHFFHLNTEDCGGTGESLVHRYWKEEVSKMENLELPYYLLNEDSKSLKRKTMKVEIADAEQEVRMLDGKYIPDLLVSVVADGGIKIDVIIEVAYKNPKNRQDYLERWQQIDIPVFEVHVNKDSVYDIDLLYSKRNEQMRDVVNKYWESVEQEMKRKQEKKDRNRQFRESFNLTLNGYVHSYIEQDAEKYFLGAEIGGEKLWIKDRPNKLYLYILKIMHPNEERFFHVDIPEFEKPKRVFGRFIIPQATYDAIVKASRPHNHERKCIEALDKARKADVVFCL